jgi:RNA polymerase sigma-70 factor (ECF subfamily)
MSVDRAELANHNAALVSGEECMSDVVAQVPPERNEVDWTRLVQENAGWLRGWVRGRVRDPELVHDICQEAFLKALRARKTLKDSSKFPSWLYRIANNTLRDYVRKAVRRRRQVAYTNELDQIEASGESESRVADEEEAERVLTMVRELPETYREPLLLLYSRQLPYAAIGEILGISENAVQVRIFRARKMLRDRLGDSIPEGHARGNPGAGA